MARTPSMSAAECEAQLGPRGALIIMGAETRAMARKWLTACGVPSSYAGKAPVSEISDAYNDLTGETLAAVKMRAAGAPDDESDDDSTVDATPPAAGNGHGELSAIERAILDIANRASPKAATVDRATVESIVDERLEAVDARLADMIDRAIADRVPNKLDVTVNGGPAVTLDGLRHPRFETALRIVACGIPLCLSGGTAAGKTTLCEQIARALGREFYITSAVDGPHALLGYNDLSGYVRTPLRESVEFGGLFLGDEADSWDPAGTLAANSVLANGYITFPDSPRPVRKHDQFAMVIAVNTIMLGADRHYVGRNQMDAATVDRFAMLMIGYDDDLERAMVGVAPKAKAAADKSTRTMTAEQWVDRVQALRAAAQAEQARIIISPRATLYGAKLLAAGLDADTVEECCVWKGFDRKVRDRIEARANQDKGN